MQKQKGGYGHNCVHLPLYLFIVFLSLFQLKALSGFHEAPSSIHSLEAWVNRLVGCGHIYILLPSEMLQHWAIPVGPWTFLLKPGIRATKRNKISSHQWKQICSSCFSAKFRTLKKVSCTHSPDYDPLHNFFLQESSWNDEFCGAPHVKILYYNVAVHWYIFWKVGSLEQG